MKEKVRKVARRGDEKERKTNNDTISEQGGVVIHVFTMSLKPKSFDLLIEIMPDHVNSLL